MKNNFKEDDKMKKNNINIKQTRISNFVWAVVRWFFLINIAFIIIYPLMYMISMAVRSPIDFLYATVVWIPKHFTLDNFKKICDAKLDFTIGSALDIFGGHLSYQEIVAKYNE